MRRYYTPTGAVNECGTDLAKWQAAGANNDPNSTVAVTPSPDAIIGWARALLLS
jgi:hypothetical protein